MQTTISNLIEMEENTVGKGEIAHHEQFLLFLQSFKKVTKKKKTFTADT